MPRFRVSSSERMRENSGTALGILRFYFIHGRNLLLPSVPGTRRNARRGEGYLAEIGNRAKLTPKHVSFQATSLVIVKSSVQPNRTSSSPTQFINDRLDIKNGQMECYEMASFMLKDNQHVISRKSDTNRVAEDARYSCISSEKLS